MQPARPAIGVHTSHSASGAGTCAYWIGRPWRARPAHTVAAAPSKRSVTRRGWSSSRLDGRGQRSERHSIAGRQQRRRRPVLGPVDGSRPRRRRSPLNRARRPQAPSDARPASRTSISDAARRGARRAGSRAASPRRWRRPDRRAEVVDEARARRVDDAAVAVDDEQLGVARAVATRRSAAIIDGASSATVVRPVACDADAGQRRGDRVGELARGRLGPLERGAVGIRHRQRVKRRVHVAGVERQNSGCLRPRAPRSRSAHVAQRGLARAVRAPLRIRVDRGVARHVQHDAAAAFARRRGQRAEQRFGQSKRPEHVGRQRQLEVFARRVGQSASGTGPRLDALFTRTSRPPRLPAICSAIG